MSAENQSKFEYTVVMHFKSENVAFRTSDVLELYFIEDILSISVMGRAQIIDVKGAIERIEDYTSDIPLSITFYRINPESNTMEEIQSKLFHIYKITALNMDATRKTKIYQILFADVSYMLFNKLRFSYSWGDKDIAPEMIIEDFCTKLAKLPYEKSEKFWETSKTKFEIYYSPFWTIRQNLQYLVPRTRSEEHDVSGYCFFISSDGKDSYKINYSSLEKMLANKDEVLEHNKLDFYQAQAPRVNAQLVECKVASWQVLSIDNSNYDNIAGSTYFGYDMEKDKAPFKCTFDYKMGIEKTTILGKTTLFEQAEKVKVEADATGLSLDGDIDPAKPVKWYMDRDPETLEDLWYDDWVKRYCQSQMLEVVTLGSSKRSVGTLVELLIPSNFKWEYGDGHGDEGDYASPELQKLHPRWSGKGLVKSITHYFQAKEPMYLQKLVIIKNGYEDVLKDAKLEPAVKSNLGSGV